MSDEKNPYQMPGPVSVNPQPVSQDPQPIPVPVPTPVKPQVKTVPKPVPPPIPTTGVVPLQPVSIEPTAAANAQPTSLLPGGEMTVDVVAANGKKHKLVVTPEGFEIQVPKGKKAGQVTDAAKWKDLRYLKNKVRKGNFFTFELEGDAHLFRVKKKNPQRERLAEILDQLPSTAYMASCPHCGAASSDNICAACGQGAASAHRKSGLLLLFGGIGLALLGVIVTVVTYKGAEGGGSYYVFYGPVIAGVVMIANGIKRLATGRK